MWYPVFYNADVGFWKMTGIYCLDANLSTSPACVPPIHKSAPATQQGWKVLNIAARVPAKTSAERTYQGRLVISVQYDDEICDGQHACRGDSDKNMRILTRQSAAGLQEGLSSAEDSWAWPEHFPDTDLKIKEKTPSQSSCEQCTASTQ